MEINQDHNRTNVVLATNGRKLIFTPERIQQVINLVERGTCREEIAIIIGCTIGTLAVTASRLGISLRKPRDNGYRAKIFSSANSGNGEGRMQEESVNENIVPLIQPTKPTVREDSPPITHPISIQISYRGRTMNTPIPMSDDMLAELAIGAEMNGMRLGEYIAAILVAIVNNDMLGQLSEPEAS
jgi:hypothetical protein